MRRSSLVTDGRGLCAVTGLAYFHFASNMVRK
jgi:hypothetical protein